MHKRHIVSKYTNTHKKLCTVLNIETKTFGARTTAKSSKQYTLCDKLYSIFKLRTGLAHFYLSNGAYSTITIQAFSDVQSMYKASKNCHVLYYLCKQPSCDAATQVQFLPKNYNIRSRHIEFTQLLMKLQLILFLVFLFSQYCFITTCVLLFHHISTISGQFSMLVQHGGCETRRCSKQNTTIHVGNSKDQPCDANSLYSYNLNN